VVRDLEASRAAGFAHAALLYQTPAEFTAGVLPFVQAGAEAGEPVMVASRGRNLAVLRARLDGLGERVSFTDLDSVGANPARLLGWLWGFTDQHRGPVRYVQEITWPSRSPEENREAMRHEALLNHVVTGWQASVLCPYDRALGTDVLASVERTHPVVLRGGQQQASPSYDPQVVVPPECDRPLADPPPGAAVLGYRDGLAQVRAFAAEHARKAGLPDHLVRDLVIAVGELAANTLAHTRGPGSLAIWATPEEVVCQVSDSGHIRDPLAGRVRPNPAEGGGSWGLWVVNQVCDLVEVRTGAGGTETRLHIRRPA
jgi:anti-sigma regulatory factor (Ser/Thr protein kinase)